METVKIVAVVGMVGTAVAVGLAYAWSAIRGGTVAGDEIARLAIMCFVVAAGTVGVLRHRANRPA